MPAPRLSVGLLGCGAISQTAHLRVLATIPDVEVTAIADPDANRLGAAGARAPQARRFASARELLDSVAVDAVVIAVPSAMHAELALAAFERGRHVYLEKPIATTMEDGLRVVEAWRGSGRLGVVGFNYRRNPLYVAAERLLREGAVGNVVAIRTVFSTHARTSSKGSDWRHGRATGGGVLLDLASHHVDLVRFLSAAEIVRVSARVRSHRTEDDTAALLLELSDGGTAEILASLSSIEDDRIEVYGDAGKLVVDRYRSLAVEVQPTSAHRSPIDRLARQLALARALPYALTKRRAVAHEPSFAIAMRDFVAAARAGGRMTPDLADGYASLTVVLAAEEAARANRVMDVAHIPADPQPTA